MSMRGSTRRAIVVDLPNFGWDRAIVSVLRHSTLPWHEHVDATPLTALKDFGTRDRLSLLGQFAAHVAFLQFAGVSDGEFDPAEWAAVRKRGSDCRLVRISARGRAQESPPVLTSIQLFAAAIIAPPLDVLRQSWGRAETVYHEIESRLRADAAADLRWLHGSAAGRVAAPGFESMRDLLAQSSGSFAAPADLTAFRALAEIDEAVVILSDDASPLVRYSAIRALRLPQSLDERAIVERIAGNKSRNIFVIASAESFDDASRRVVDLLQASRVGVWVGREGQELPEGKSFLLSPVLGAMPAGASSDWLERFVHTPAFVRYLDEGELPDANNEAGVTSLREPLRSFIAAVALLGRRVPKTLVDHFLERVLSAARAADLVTEGVCALDGEEFVFASDEIRREMIEAIPPSSRASLARVAQDVVQTYASLLESMQWRSAEETIRTLRALPPSALSEPLKRTLAEALFAAGRYRDAREFASEPLLARIERRMGDYGSALSRLERLGTRDFDSELLRAEILLLLDRADDAATALDQCVAITDDDQARLAYQRAIQAIETGGSVDETIENEYFAARVEVYRTIATRDLDSAVSAARKAIDTAPAMHDRVDATLDLLFALFCSGEWGGARAAALDALLLVDQTQGDRAAGGILFMLAFLAADDGQWTHATHLLERLRKFYGDMRDEKRLAELEMIAAAIDFSRGRFSAAERAANAVLATKTSDQIRETAALMLDEIDWIQRRAKPLRSIGKTANVELTTRHALLRARRRLAHGALGPFAAQLFDWENGGSLPEVGNGSEKLVLFRAALGRGRNDVVEKIASELHIGHEAVSEDASESELRILCAASALAFPFARNDFSPMRWRFATRNRLGQWQEIGSVASLSAAELDAILASPTDDWIACSDRELLYIDDLSQWSAGAREAVASLFHVRAEHHRLRRLVDEDPIEARSESIEGIVGESQAMRDVYEVIARVAKRDVPVCILGESGTGKELVARAIHHQSSRRHKPYTPINCAALPENLIESELFGHTRGAFTGADRDRAGLIETTDRGTLFLDEIGEMPLTAQAKLLRFLQEGEFRRVGETVNRSADVRVVTATNRKLEAAVEQGRFREDLYYRVRGVEIVLPPLRDRANDIPLLASHFLCAEQKKHRSGPARLSAEVEAAFASYHWPGNIRELQNTIRAAHALAGDAREIDLEHLPERLRGIKIVRTPLGSYQDAVARFRRELIEKSLLQANGNQNQAAAMLKISRQALAYQIRELGILVKPLKQQRT